MILWTLRDVEVCDPTNVCLTARNANIPQAPVSNASDIGSKVILMEHENLVILAPRLGHFKKLEAENNGFFPSIKA